MTKTADSLRKNEQSAVTVAALAAETLPAAEADTGQLCGSVAPGAAHGEGQGGGCLHHPDDMDYEGAFPVGYESNNSRGVDAYTVVLDTAVMDAMPAAPWRTRDG